MMKELFIISRDRRIYSGEFKSITLPFTSGLATILPNHAPILGELKPGVISFVNRDGETVEIKQRRGFVVVSSQKTEVAIVEDLT